MRITLVTQRFYPLVGGAESVLRALAGEWAHHGCDVHVVAARYDPNWPAHETVDGIPVTRLPLPAVRFVGTARYVLALRRYLVRHRDKTDIVYVSMLKHQAWAAISVRQSLERPVVLRAEGAGATGDVAWQRQALLGERIRRACLAADAIVAPSRLVHEELVEAGYPATRLHLIRNAVCCRTYRPPTAEERASARSRLAVAGPIVGYVGRLSPEKGIEELIAAWPAVKQTVPDAMLLVAGGPASSKWAQRLTALPGVCYLGEVRRPAEILHALDLFVLPSHFEGISIALLEAMACGVVPVVSAIAGNLEVVGQQDAVGWVFESRRAERLAAVLIEALRARRRWPELSVAVRQRVEQCFALQAAARRHLELFRAVLAGTGPDRSHTH